MIRTSSVFILLLSMARAFAPISSLPPARSSTALQMGLLNRFRKKKALKVPEQIKIGASLPEMDVQVVGLNVTDDSPMGSATIHEVVGGAGTNLLVGMPGAYTPTCSQNHMPGYVQQADKLKKLGVDTIAVVTTNDKFVNDAWARDLGIVGSSDDEKQDDAAGITVLADGDGDLVRELGLIEDMGYGVGVRSKRFAMILQDGVVCHLEIDEGMDSCEKSTAENMVKLLGGTEVIEESDMDMNAVAGIGVVLVAAIAAFVAFSGGGGGDAGSAASDTGSLLKMYGS